MNSSIDILNYGDSSGKNSGESLQDLQNAHGHLHVPEFRLLNVILCHVNQMHLAAKA